VAGVSGRAAEAVLAAVRAAFDLPDTLRRVCDPAFARPVVITNARYRFLVAEQLSEIAVRRRYFA
jgi:mannose-1-phosphate guanylyltransferase